MYLDGLNIYVSGLKEDAKDENYVKMKKILTACRNADVSIPKEVIEYFSTRDVAGKGSHADIDYAIARLNRIPVSYSIDISIIPNGVKYIVIEEG